MPKGEKGTARPYRRGQIWWIKYYVPGESKPRRESSGSVNKNDALKLLNQRRAEVDRRQVSSPTATVQDLLPLYLEDQKKQKRKSYQQAKGYVRLHLGPVFGKIKASELTSRTVDRFIQTKREQQYADASINRMLEVLRRSFKLGQQASPPLVFSAPRIDLLEEDNVREGFLEHSEYLRLRELLPDHQRLVLVIGDHLGLRCGEILQLRWDQVDWQHNVIRLERRQTKSKKARVAPLYGELRGWLEMAFAQRSPDCPFLVSYRGRSISEVKSAWQTARQKANLPQVLLHDLRRTAVRNMIRAGISDKMAMLISGHKTRSMFDRYHIIDERDIVQAGYKMERYLESLDSVGTKVGTEERTDTPLTSKQAHGFNEIDWLLR